jgi:DNA polymerase-3 subunit gamma/tau
MLSGEQASKTTATDEETQRDPGGQAQPVSDSAIIGADISVDNGNFSQIEDQQPDPDRQPVEERPQLEPDRQPVEERPQLEPDRQPVEERPQLEPENDESIHWSSFACELGLQGLALEIALNSTLETLQEDYICLNLNREILELVNPAIEDEIRQAIEIKLGVSLKLELLAQDELEVETPQQYKQRELQNQKQATIEEIRQDRIVKKLNDAFGAELIESSVRKIKR